jgi:gamma-glutamyltranspeptidase/glutathione hydrolase
MMVSLIQSNYHGFGSGLVVPGTGVALHNRGGCFTTVAGHPNAPAPGKRPMNTIIPGFLSDGDERPLAAFGVMGGAIQAQAHVQVVHRLVDHDLQPQAAIDAPRFRIADDGAVLYEERAAESLRAALVAKGHVLKPIGDWASESGSGQIIMRCKDGYICGTDGRRDSTVAVA